MIDPNHALKGTLKHISILKETLKHPENLQHKLYIDNKHFGIITNQHIKNVNGKTYYQPIYWTPHNLIKPNTITPTEYNRTAINQPIHTANDMPEGTALQLPIKYPTTKTLNTMTETPLLIQDNTCWHQNKQYYLREAKKFVTIAVTDTKTVTGNYSFLKNMNNQKILHSRDHIFDGTNYWLKPKPVSSYAKTIHEKILKYLYHKNHSTLTHPNINGLILSATNPQQWWQHHNIKNHKHNPIIFYRNTTKVFANPKPVDTTICYDRYDYRIISHKKMGETDWYSIYTQKMF